MNSKALRSALKRAVSLTLLGLIAYSIASGDGWSDLLAAAQQFSGAWFAVALVLPWIAVGASVLRWRTLLNAEGVHLPVSHLAWTFLRGRFIGAFTPSTTGLDLYRAVAVAKSTGDRAVGGRVVLVEKLYGLVALALVTLALLPLGLTRFFGVLGVMVAVGLGVVSVGGLFWMERHARTMQPPTSRWLAKLHTVATSASLSSSARGRVLILGVLCHAATAFGFAAAGRALGLDVPVLQLAIVGNAIVLAMLIPISVGGFGVREGTAIALLATIGVPASAALSMALLGYLVAQPPAILGGLSTLVGDERPQGIELPAPASLATSSS